MSRARQNPIGLPIPSGITVVRAGAGGHTHVLDPVTGGLLCKSGKNPKLFRSNAQFITCYRCIKMVMGRRENALANPAQEARPNPLTEPHVFSPSYPADSQAEYDRRVAVGEKKAAKAKKRSPSKHRQVSGGRSAARFSEYGPSPRDPSPGHGARSKRSRGPRREGGKIVGGEASKREVSQRTRERLASGTPPWEARTQSPKVWVQTLDRMGYRIPEAALEQARKNPETLPHPWVKSGDKWLLSLPGCTYLLKQIKTKGPYHEKWSMYIQTPVRGGDFDQTPGIREEWITWAVTLEEVADVAYAHMPPLTALAIASQAQENPRVPGSYPRKVPGKKGLSTRRAVLKLAAQVEAGFDRYRATSPDGAMGLYVPLFAAPLLDAGVPASVAHTLVRRAGGKFYSATPFLPPAPPPRTFGELLVTHFRLGPKADSVAGRVEMKGAGYIQQVGLRIGDRDRVTTLLTADKIEKHFAEYVDRVKRASSAAMVAKARAEGRVFDTPPKGQYLPDLDDSAFNSHLFSYLDDRAAKLAIGALQDKRTFIVRFSSLKTPVALAFSPAPRKGSTPSASSTTDRAPSVRYKTLENVPLAVLPALLARIALRTRREGRHLSPLPSNS